MGIIIGDINLLSESNLGGSRYIDLIDVNICPDFNIKANEVTDEIVDDPLDWSRINPSLGTLDFGFTPVNRGGIVLYDTKLSLTIPKHRLGIDRVVSKLKQTRWIVLLYGYNNDVIVLGTKDAPLKFAEIDVRYKPTITNRNAYRWEFSVLSGNRPAFYHPAPNTKMRWEDGQLMQWEDGTQMEFENV